MMKRRSFIKLSATASAIGLLPNQISNALDLGEKFINCDISNRKLVLIFLGGGNDGLNTIIPLNQYDLYSNLRPTLKVPESGSSSYINLDTSLGDEQLVGLHPSLSGFKHLYDSGFLRIIQGVGYPSQNKSHFASTDVYNTGNDGNSWLNGGNSGWIGRFIESYYYDLVEQSFPIGVEIGSKTSSLGFHGAQEHGLSLNIEGQDASGFYSVLSGLGGEAPSFIPNSHYGEELQYIIDNDQTTTIYSEAISNAFNNGSNSVNYEDTDLSNQLKKIVYPRGVFLIKYEKNNIDDKFMSSIISFIYLYIIIFFIITALLSISGLDFVTSISGAATSISNVGPGIGENIGPNGNFSQLSSSSKWILSLGMIMGRLEIFAILILFIPSFWRKY